MIRKKWVILSKIKKLAQTCFEILPKGLQISGNTANRIYCKYGTEDPDPSEQGTFDAPDPSFF